MRLPHATDITRYLAPCIRKRREHTRLAAEEIERVAARECRERDVGVDIVDRLRRIEHERAVGIAKPHDDEARANRRSREIARFQLVIRMVDKVGTFANVLNVIKRHGINVEEVTNTVFEGGVASCANMSPASRPVDMRIIVTPLCVSPRYMAQAIGAAPR